MKKNYLIIIFLLLVQGVWAQTTETFETENPRSTTFTDNLQSFTITSQQGGIFDIQSSFPGTGWNGTSADNRYIDNDSYARPNAPMQFTVSTTNAAPFKLKSMWLFLSTNNLNLNVNGQTLTITGKLGGVTKFIASINSGFNTQISVSNGFTYIDFATFGGQNNSNIVIDQYEILTTNGINYISLDAMRWQCAAPEVLLASQNHVTCFGGNDGSASVAVSGATQAYTYDWSPGNPAGDGTASVTGLKAGRYTCTVTSTCGASTSMDVFITEPAAMSLMSVKTDVSCHQGTDGKVWVDASGGTYPYTYLWSNGRTDTMMLGLAPGNYTVTATDAKGCTATKTITITQPTPLSATHVSSNVSCNGMNNGSATVTPSGGTPGYSFSWSPSGGSSNTAANLSAGTYSVTITDGNDCSITQTIIITQPDALSATAVVNNIVCHGGSGSINLTASGGTAPYNYVWNNGATSANVNGLFPGNYSVTITDANNCTTTENYSIMQPNALSVSLSPTHVSCYQDSNGAITASASGGTAPYTYQWSNAVNTPSITGLTAGTYTVNVTDTHGCTVSQSVIITQPPAITATVFKTDTCAGGASGSATVSVSGGTGNYTYQWTPNISNAATATGLAAGDYSVRITDETGCVINQAITITGPSIPLTVAANGTNVTCNYGSDGTATAIASGGMGNYTYLWSTGATTQTITGLTAGTYTVTVSDGAGCSPVLASVTLSQPDAMAVQVTVTEIACYGGTASATVSSVIGGAAPYTYAWSNGATGDSAYNLAAGSYNVLVTDANGCRVYKYFDVWAPIELIAYNETNNTRDVSCHGGSDGIGDVSHYGGTGPFTYQWLPYGGNNMMATNLSPGDFTVTVTDSRGCSATVPITIGQPAAITATIQTTNAICATAGDGAASVTATGGSGNLAYSWSHGASGASVSGLYPGDYTVTITDTEGCSITENFTITAPEFLNVYNADVTYITCTNPVGSIDLNVSGGVAPYSYQWSNGSTQPILTDLTPGLYSVTVTDSVGCSASNEFYLNVPNALFGEIYTEPVSCAGTATGSAAVYIYGGSEGPFTYLWSNGDTASEITGLTAGEYSVVVTAPNGCSATFNATIYESESMIVDIDVQQPSCAGDTGSASVVVSGTEGAANILWSNGSTGTMAGGFASGNHSVTVTNEAGCTVVKNFTITVPEVLLAEVAYENILCQGQTSSVAVSVNGGTPPYSYYWSTGQNTPSVSGLIAGTHTVTISDARNCTIQSVFTITQPAAPLVVTINSGIVMNSCYGDASGTATAVAAGGVAPYIYQWSSGATTQGISGLTAGTYTVTVTDANGCTAATGVTITAPPAISNDNCENAQALFLGNTAASNACASQSAGNLPACSTSAYDTWYRFNSGPNTMLTLNIDMNYAVYSGFCNALAEIACGTGVTELNVSVNTVYYIRAYSTTKEGRGNFTINLSVPCLAPAGLAVVSDASSVSATWTAAVIAPTNGYQYEVRTSGLPGSGNNGLAVTGTSTGLSQIVNGLNPGTEYTYYLRSSCGDGRYSEWAAGAPFFTGFCTPSPTSGIGIGITNVRFDTVANATGAETGNYADYTAITGSVQRANVTTVNVTTAVQAYVKVWVDWNNDMDFNDAGEEVYAATAATNNTAATFSIPASASVGNHRMRIGAGTALSLVPCYTGSAAAFEDYTLNVDTLGPVNLNDAACNSTLDNFTKGLYTNNILNAQSYRFRVKNGANEEIIIRNTSYFTLSMLTAPAYGVTYIIDVSVMINGTWTDYGKVCTVTTSNMVSSLEECVDGGASVESFSKAIYAKYIPMATNYRFKVSSPEGTVILDRHTRHFSLNMLATYNYSVNYTIQVAVLVNGVWSEYGPACTVRVDMPAATLRSVYCNSVVAKKGTAIYANNYPGAVTFHFRVTVNGNQYVVARNVGYFFLSSVPATINPGMTVGVEVKVFSATAESAYGTSCAVTLAGAANRPDNADSTGATINLPLTSLKGFPNPFTETFALDFETESQEMVAIVVYDMTGKLIDKRSISVNELPTLKIGDNFAAGVYNLILTQGETVKTIRVVKNIN